MISSIPKITSLVLILGLSLGSTLSASPQNKKLIHVGYVGESLENIPDAYAKMIRQKMLGLINQNYYEFYHPNDLYQSHPSQVDAVKAHNNNSFVKDLSELASVSGLNYIFSTHIENIADTNERVMLKGEVIRFNRSSNDVYRYEILSYVEDLDLHLNTLKDELINTIPHSVYGIGKNRVFLLLGVAFVLLFAMSQTFGGFDNIFGGGGESKDPEPPIGT